MNEGETGDSGFSRGVHSHYAHYADNADAKIGALFGINFAVAGLLLGNVPGECVAATLSWIAIGSDGLAGAALLYGIYPRVASGPASLHWETVYQEPSAQAYAEEVTEISSATAEVLYAENNYYVAGVLHRKFLAIRFSIWLTAIALMFAVASVIAR